MATTTQFWTGKGWGDWVVSAKQYKSEAIATNAMKKIMLSGRESEQNIAVKKSEIS